MNENIYYIPIQSTSLAHYFGKALILPTRFYKKRPSDIQNINSDYLVLSKKKFLNNSNCSIELVLDEEEVNYLSKIKDDNTFLYSKPIPISRIKQVYFRDEIQKLKTIDNINRGTAFIPTTLTKVIEEENINIDIIVRDTFNYSSELESKIKTYNHILGGLTFVKYTLEGKYSENYFSILSHFNSYIINNYIEKKNIFKGYDGAFTYIGKVWDKLSPLIYENISENDVERYAKEENISIDKSNGVFKYELLNENNIKSLTYKLAILNIYGEDSNKRKKTDDLISDCKNGKIPKEKQEDIALIYGINHGYSSFRNQYNKKIVKFKMESLLDYYTIESVFQYVINDKKDNEKFEYIDEIFPDEELVLDIGKEAFNIEAYSTNIFKYFTEKILYVPLKELFHNIINQFKNTFIEEMNKKDSKLENMKLKIEELNQKNVSKEEEIQTINNDMNVTKDKEIKALKEKITELKKSIENIDNKVTFDEEKERIIIEQTLETYLKYDSKKAPEIKKIAKERGLEYTNKSDTIKLILTCKDNRLFE